MAPCVVFASLLLASQPPLTGGDVAPVSLDPPAAPGLPMASGTPSPAMDGGERRRRASGAIVAGVALYGAGAAATWSTAAASGRLGDEERSDPGRGQGAVAGLVLASQLRFCGALALALGLGARNVGRASRAAQRTRARAHRVGGAGLALLGAGGLYATALMWPRLRERCSADLACGLGALEASSLAFSGGIGLLGYGSGLAPRPGRADRRVRVPLAVGAFLFVDGYLATTIAASRIGAGAPGARTGGRALQRSAIPLAGPWLVAGSPDLPLLPAAAFAGFGAIQAAGGVALLVGGVRAGLGRREARRVGAVRFAPAPGGLSISGEF